MAAAGERWPATTGSFNKAALSAAGRQAYLQAGKCSHVKLALVKEHQCEDYSRQSTSETRPGSVQNQTNFTPAQYGFSKSHLQNWNVERKTRPGQGVMGVL